MKGVAGQTASLPCYIDEANCGDIYFLTWSKLDREEKWSRIWVYSDENVNKALSNLAGRARFSKESAKAQLIINGLTPADESLYKVGVLFSFLLFEFFLGSFCCCSCWDLLGALCVLWWYSLPPPPLPLFSHPWRLILSPRPHLPFILLLQSSDCSAAALALALLAHLKFRVLSPLNSILIVVCVPNVKRSFESSSSSSRDTYPR